MNNNIDIIEGWLEHNGICHCQEPQENKNGVTLEILPSENVLRINIPNGQWKDLSTFQRKWLSDVARNGYEVVLNKIISGTTPVNPPMKVKVASNKKEKKSELTESKIKYSSIMSQLLLENMSFNDLLKASKMKPDNSRMDRAKYVNTRHLRVGITSDGETMMFTYKSDKQHSTTKKRWHGTIQFFEEDTTNMDAGNLDCKVYCDCPDFFYRWEYNNTKAGASDLSKNHNGQPPRPRDGIPPGVGDLGEGLCKHLITIAEWIKQTVDDTLEPIKKTKVEPPVPNMPSPTTDYSDSRSLQENINASALFDKFKKLANTNVEFDVPYYDEEPVSEELLEGYHHHHKDYRLYEGNREIIAMFGDNSRLSFEVHFRDNHKEDKEKWRSKALTTWKSLANEIYKEVTEFNTCNPVQKSWKECFREALKHPKLQEYIRNNHHQRVFPDKGYPAHVQGKAQPVIDPVNFTRTN